MKKLFVGLAAILMVMLFAVPMASATTASTTYEWGHPVAKGGPGAVPTALPLVSQEAFVDAGNSGDAAITPSGTIQTWGGDSKSMTSVNQPGPTNVVQIQDGDDIFIALSAPSGTSDCPTDTSVWVWGHGEDGDLGTGVATQVSSTPIELPSLSGIGVVQVVAASRHMMALTCTGQVYVWGWNVLDDLALSKPDQLDVPTFNSAISSLTGGTSNGVMLSDGRDQSSILVNGQEWTWGDDESGQCGCGFVTKQIATPVKVTQSTPFAYIDDGGDEGDNGHDLALDANGNVYCWGYNALGECGQGNPNLVDTPTVVPGLPTAATVAAGGEYSLVLDTSGNVWAFGYNGDHEVDSSGNTAVTSPEEIFSGATQISAGAQHAVAVVG